MDKVFTSFDKHGQGVHKLLVNMDKVFTTMINMDKVFTSFDKHGKGVQKL